MTPDVLNVVLGVSLGALGTAFFGQWKFGADLAALRAEVEGLRRDMDRLLERSSV